MQSALSQAVRFCLKHENEPILRVSLDPKSPQLFYCHECLNEIEKDKQPKLIKFHEFVEALHKKLSIEQPQASEENKEDAVSDHSLAKDQFMTKFQGFLANHKQAVEEEFDCLEGELIGILKTSKDHAYSRLDGLKENFKNELNEFSENARSISSEKRVQETKITKEELYKEMTKEESLEETEKKVRDILNKAQAAKDIRSGKVRRVLARKKTSLDSVLQSSDLIPKKENAYYQQKLEILNGYLEAMVFVDDDDPKGSDARNLNKEYKQTLMQIKDSLKNINEAIVEKAKDVSTSVNNLLVPSSEETCSLLAFGYNKVEGEGYFCETCFGQQSNYKNISGVLVCETCRFTCHADHSFSEGAIQAKFACSCQFVSSVCKFAHTCISKHTGTNFVQMARYQFKDGDSSVGLCHFCATVCHNSKETEFIEQESSSCQCPSTFPFCKANKQEGETA